MIHSHPVRLPKVLPALFAIATLALASTASAQLDVTTGRITGFTKLQDGSGLPGVTVTCVNKETAWKKVVSSDKNGFYTCVDLPIGFYKVDATLDGFVPISADNVRLSLGSAPTIDFTMMPKVEAAVTVTGTRPAVEVTNTTVSETIQTEQLKNLPVSGRDFKNLVLLTPATSIESQRNYIQVSGQRAINTNVTVDGTDYNDPFFGGNVGSAEGRAPLSMSEESIKEFTVITNGASVEFGRSGGGFVNVVTKSGTNTAHGSGFFYWQPLATTADFANGKPPVDQDKKQYGGSLGGPIIKDKLFFFGSYDGQKQTITQLINPIVLNPAIFAAYPVLAGPDNYVQGRNGWVGFGRADAQITDSQRVQGRINYASYTGQNGTNSSANDTLQHNGIEAMKSVSTVGTWSSQYGASILNDFNFNYTHESVPRQDKGLNLPEIRVGSARYGEVSFLPIVSTSKRYEVADTFTYLIQNHVVKAGGDYNDTSVAQTFKGNWRGIFFFNTNADLLAGKYNQYAQFGGLSGLTADEAGTVGFGQKEYSGFVQDQWFVNEKLTVTAGVRYEYLNNPNALVLNVANPLPSGQFPLNATIPDVNNQWSPRLSISYAPDPKTAIRLTAGRYWSRTPGILWSQLFSSNGLKGVQYTSNNAGPNAGLDPTNPGCTLTNGTSCYDPLAPGWGANWTPEPVERINLSGIPAGTAGLPAFAVDPNFTNPHTDRATLGFEREVVPSVTVAIAATYAKGYHLERLTDANRVYDGTISANGEPHYSNVRPNHFYSTITEYVSDAQAWYDDITLVVDKRFSNSFSANVTATFSHDRDTDSNERNFSGIQAEDFNHLNTMYAYSDRDRRWRASTNAVWSTPWYGIGLAGSLRFQTGLAYSPKANFDFNGDGQSSTDFPTLNCTPIGSSVTNYDCSNGIHLGRNSYRQPSLYSLDFRLTKAFRLGPGDLNLSADCYNCTNTGNKFVSQTTFGRVPGPDPSNPTQPNTSKPNAGFANPNQPGTPLTAQFSLRYDF